MLSSTSCIFRFAFRTRSRRFVYPTPCYPTLNPPPPNILRLFHPCAASRMDQVNARTSSGIRGYGHPMPSFFSFLSLFLSLLLLPFFYSSLSTAQRTRPLPCLKTYLTFYQALSPFHKLSELFFFSFTKTFFLIFFYLHRLLPFIHF